MHVESPTIPVGAIWYPQDHEDPNRLKRAHLYGINSVPNETVLVQQAKSRFTLHKPARTYHLSLEGKGPTVWTDTDKKAVAMQVELAQEAELDFFLINVYVWSEDGGIKTELDAPLDVIVRQLREKHIKFALNFCFHKPRSVIPVPLGFKEERRHISATKETFEAIVDFLVPFLELPNYLTLGSWGHPFVSFYGLDPRTLDRDERNPFRWITEKMERTINKRPGLLCYAVAKTPLDALRFQELGFFGTMTYSDLPSFTGEIYHDILGLEDLQEYKPQPAFLQSYLRQLYRQTQTWWNIAQIQTHSNKKTNHIPTSVIGWDASYRAHELAGMREATEALSNGASFEDLYPLFPIVVEANPMNFLKMLDAIFLYLQEFIRWEYQFVLINAWNEIAEGSSMIPYYSRTYSRRGERFKDSHNLVTDYLYAVRDFKRSLPERIRDSWKDVVQFSE